jgi:hypothetical protein
MRSFTFLLLALPSVAIAFVSTGSGWSTSHGSGASQLNAHSMDHLKFDGKPTFDVLQRTKDFVQIGIDTKGDYPDGWLADDFILRGPVVGPTNSREDLKETQKFFKLLDAYPDIETNPFGFCVDPENPYRCFWFEKWTATHTGTMQGDLFNLPATGKKVETPIVTLYVVWNPEGTVLYEDVGMSESCFALAFGVA